MLVSLLCHVVLWLNNNDSNNNHYISFWQSLAPLPALNTYTVITLVNPTIAPGTTLIDTAAESDPNGTATPVTASIIVGAASADLSVLNSGSPVVEWGGNEPIITYGLIVSNLGPSAATNVVITDTLPSFSRLLTFRQLSGPVFSLPTCVSNDCGTTTVVAATLPSLSPGSTAVFQLSVCVCAGTNSRRHSCCSLPFITNTATVTSSTADPVLSNNISSVNSIRGPTSNNKRSHHKSC